MVPFCFCLSSAQLDSITYICASALDSKVSEFTRTKLNINHVYTESISTTWSGFSVFSTALANGDEAIAKQKSFEYVFGLVHKIETLLNVKPLANIGGVE